MTTPGARSRQPPPLAAPVLLRFETAGASGSPAAFFAGDSSQAAAPTPPTLDGPQRRPYPPHLLAPTDVAQFGASPGLDNTACYRQRCPRGRAASPPTAHAGRMAGSAHLGSAPDPRPFRSASRMDPAWETVLDPQAAAAALGYTGTASRTPSRCHRAVPPARHRSVSKGTDMGAHTEAYALFSRVVASSGGLVSLSQAQAAVAELAVGPAALAVISQLHATIRAERVRSLFNAIARQRGGGGERLLNRKEFCRLVDRVGDESYWLLAPAIIPTVLARRSPPRLPRSPSRDRHSEVQRRRAISPTRSSTNKSRRASPRAVSPARRDAWRTVRSMDPGPPPNHSAASTAVHIVHGHGTGSPGYYTYATGWVLQHKWQLFLDFSIENAERMENHP